MTIVTDLTGETSDSDNHKNDKSDGTNYNKVTPNKPRNANVQATIESTLIRGYSSGRLHAHTLRGRNNWAGHNQFCHSTLIYHVNHSFEAPSYNTVTISPTLPVTNQHVTSLPPISTNNKTKH